MAIVAKTIIPAKILENSQTTQYTATNVTTIIDKFTATNYTSGAVTVSVNLVTSGDTAGNQNLIAKTVSIPASSTYNFPEVVGHIIQPGGFISTIASAATSVTLRASGREVS
jgi:hypothetical protein